jgi:hypothetical protein
LSSTLRLSVASVLHTNQWLAKCRIEVVSAPRRRVKEIVVAEAGDACLLCANCHAEVEAGIATIAPGGPADNVV